MSEIEVFGQEKFKLRFLVKKLRFLVIYVVYQISDKIVSKKGLQKFWAVKLNFYS